MTPKRPLMRKLPIGTVLKTGNGYVWKKIDFNRFICIGHPEYNSWELDDIYTAGSTERVTKTDTIYNFIIYYELWKKQVKS